jgi:Mn-dependent DtxR family transcriptional regulator
VIPPTAEHVRYLKAIRDLTHEGVPPTLRQIGAEVNASPGQVCNMLHRMRERGLIDFEDGRSRTLRIVGEVEALEDRPTSELRNLRARIDAILSARFEPLRLVRERVTA